MIQPRANERVFLNDQDISEIVVSYIPDRGALVFIFMPNGKRLKTTAGDDYRCFVYGRLEIKPIPEY